MEGRSGHILIPGLTIGASHAPLNELIDAAESAKAKRSMYAETHHERQEILRAVRESEWNAEMDPVVVTLLAPGTVEHDFSEGYVSDHDSRVLADLFVIRPCNVAVSFVLRNFSSTNPCRVVLKLSSDLVSPLTLCVYNIHFSMMITHAHRSQGAPASSIRGPPDISRRTATVRISHLPSQGLDSTSRGLCRRGLDSRDGGRRASVSSTRRRGVCCCESSRSMEVKTLPICTGFATRRPVLYHRLRH